MLNISSPHRFFALIAVALFAVIARPAGAQQYNCWGSHYNDAVNGMRQCVGLEPRPSEWKFGLGFASCNHCAEGWIEADCVSRGGTWSPSPGCLGENVCQGENQTTTEAMLAPLANSIINYMYPTCTNSTQDTGWGANQSTECGFTAGPDAFQFGILTRSSRVFTHNLTNGAQCTPPKTRYHLAGKSRTITVGCPVGTLKACLSCGNYCTRSTDNTCPVGNPVKPGTGAKVHVESDVSLPGGLEFKRHYNSQGFFLPGGASYVSNVPMDRGGMFGFEWRGSYEQRLFPSAPTQAGGQTTTSMGAIYRPDGSLQYFRLNGMEALPAPNAIPGRLTRLAASCPTARGAACYEYRAGSTNEVERYNFDGLLIEIADGVSGQRSRTMTYDATYRLTRVTDERGRYLQFNYDGFRLRSVVSPDGSTVRYVYDGRDRLTKVEFDDLAQGVVSRTFAYEKAGADFWKLLTGITDERGIRFATYDYDAQGRVSATRRAPNQAGGTIDQHLYTYGWTGSTWGADGTTQTTTVVDPMGASKTFTIERWKDSLRLKSLSQPCATCGGNAAQTSYDANGFTAQVTDFNGTSTTYQHDAFGRETQRVEAALFAGVVPPEKRIIETDWHPTMNVVSEVRTRTSAGALLAVEKFAYNARGQKTARCLVDPAVSYTCSSTGVPPAGVRRTLYTYCEASDTVLASSCPIIGLPRTIDGPRTDVSDVTTYSYRAGNEARCATNGACTYRKGDLWKIVNAAGQATEYQTYDKAGRPLRTLSAAGVVTDRTYHPRGWLLTSTIRVSPSGTPHADDLTTEFQHDAAGNLTKVIQPDGSFLAYAYDDAHRITRISDNVGAHVDYILDAAGNIVVEKTFDLGNSLKRRIARQFDLLSRLDKERDALASNGLPLVAADVDDNTKGRLVADVGHDNNGNRTEIIDGLGRDTDLVYDPLQRLSRRLDPLRPACVPGDADCGKTEFRYDARDNLTSVRDGRGIVTQYGYDGLSNLVVHASPESGTTTATFDAAGNRLTQTDARGIVASFGYDLLNRLTSVSYPTPALNLTFDYDTSDARCQAGEVFPVGHLTGFVDPSGSTRICFDRAGRPVRKVQDHSGVVLELAYRRDRAGRIDRLRYPSGMIVLYTRDTVGRITQVQRSLDGATWTSVVSAVGYLPMGPLSLLTFGDGSTLARRHDANYAIDAIEASSASGLDVEYTLDVSGNVTALGRSIGGAPENTFVYDLQNRLTDIRDANAASIEKYMYDAIGNRTSKQVGAAAVQAYAYAAGNSRLAAVGGVPRAYDAAGNTTQLIAGGAARTLAYDDRNRLASVMPTGSPALATGFIYNARGQRVGKAGPSGNDTWFIYDESGRLLGEYDHKGNVRVEYIWLNNLPIALQPNSATTGLDLLYVHADHLGSPRRIPGNGGSTPAWEWPIVNNAFGEQQPQTISACPTSGPCSYVPLSLNLRFPGQYADVESGLHYNYFRDFDPATGRYLESDPIGLRGGPGTYNYAWNRPLSLTDSLGLKADWGDAADTWDEGYKQMCSRFALRLFTGLEAKLADEAAKFPWGCPFACTVCQPYIIGQGYQPCPINATLISCVPGSQAPLVANGNDDEANELACVAYRGIGKRQDGFCPQCK